MIINYPKQAAFVDYCPQLTPGNPCGWLLNLLNPATGKLDPAYTWAYIKADIQKMHNQGNTGAIFKQLDGGDINWATGTPMRKVDPVMFDLIPSIVAECYSLKMMPGFTLRNDVLIQGLDGLYLSCPVPIRHE